MPGSNPQDPDYVIGETATQVHASALSSLHWSRYCPECGVRGSMAEQVCPDDGTPLRDLSVSSTWYGGEATAPPPVSATICPRCGRETGSEGHTCVGRDAPAHETAHPLVGRTLGGRWRVEKWVGRGGFGDFFRGRHEILDMPVGIKVLRRMHTRTEEVRRRFYREALRVSRLDHPNVVKVFDYGEEDDRPFLVMEFLNGQSLAHHLRSGELPLRTGIEVVRQAGVALIAAHQGDQTGGPLVHLDLKPEHFFLEEVRGGWQVKVIDFGLAEIAAGEEGAVSVAGTLPYMAPERWRGVVDPGADLYSLGIVLYELIAGRLPFHACDPLVMKRLHQEEVPTPPSRHRSAKREPLLGELDTVALRALEKDTEARPASAEELVEALEDWQKRSEMSALGRAVRRAASLSGTAKATVASIFVLAALVASYLATDVNIAIAASKESRAADPVVTMGPDEEPGRIPVTVSGWAYDHGDAVVVLRKQEGAPEHRLIPYFEKEKDEYQLAWHQVSHHGNPGQETEYEAHLEIAGFLGRRFPSTQFKLVVDLGPPRLTPGPGLHHHESDLYLEAPPVTFDFSPPGGEGALAGDGGAQPSRERYLVGLITDAQTLSVETMVGEGNRTKHPVQEGGLVELETAADKLFVKVDDGNGNDTEHTFTLHWFEPDVKGSSETEKGEVVHAHGGCVSCEVPARASVRLEPGAFVGPGDGSGERAREFRVPFDETSSDGNLQTRDVVISVWPSDDQSGKPLASKSVRVHYHKRHVSLRKLQNDPLHYEVVDSQGQPVDNPIISGTVYTLEKRGGRYPWGAQSELVPTEAKLSEQGRLLGDWGPPDWRYVRLHATDQYGNEAPAESFYPQRAPPLAVEISVPAGNPGSFDRRMHAAWCCDDSSDEHVRHEKVVFNCRIFWPFEGQLPEVVLKRKQNRKGETKAYDVGRDGELVIPRADLGELKPGRNVVEFELRDRDTRRAAKGEAMCDVYLMDKWGFRRDDFAVVNGEKTDVFVHFRRSDVSSVRIAGEIAEKREDGTWGRKDVAVDRAGPTHVKIAVEADAGCKKQYTVPYCRTADSTAPYKFVLGKNLGIVECRQYRSYNSVLWYTSCDSARKILDLFRQNNPSQAGSGVGPSGDEARSVAEWVTKEIVPKLRGQGRAELPSRDALVVLSKNEADREPRPEREWIRVESDAAVCCFAKWEKGSVDGERRFAFRTEVGPAFRLVFRETELSAVNAQESVR